MCSGLSAKKDNPMETEALKPRTFWPTVIAILLMDLSLSVDNVVTAVAMSSDIRVVCLGVCLGLLTLWMFATLSLKLVEKFPVLQHAAFLLIGYVGAILCAEMTADYAFHTQLHIGPGRKFIGVVIIMAFSLWYSRSAAVRRTSAPLLRVANWPMVLYAKVSATLIGILLWPFKALASLVR
jgi:predicted tellurium resistance membrane protein TerC